MLFSLLFGLAINSHTQHKTKEGHRCGTKVTAGKRNNAKEKAQWVGLQRKRNKKEVCFAPLAHQNATNQNTKRKNVLVSECLLLCFETGTPLP